MAPMNRILTRSLPALAVAALSFGATGCSSVQYFHIAMNPLGAATGNNCAGTTTDTYSDIASSTEWAIYTAPNNTAGQAQYLLEGAVSGALLVGTLSNGTYTFSGSKTQSTTMDNLQVATTDNVTLMISSSGVTGTMSQEVACNSGDGHGCSGAMAATQGPNFDCTTSAMFVGTALTNVTAEHTQGSQSSGSLGAL
jgi:hypothetical protein